MISIVYEVDAIPFRGAVIKAAFKNSGLVPYNRALILSNAHKNIGDFSRTRTDSLVEYINPTTEYILSRINALESRKAKVTTHRVTVRPNTLFSPQQLIENERLVKEKQLEKERAQESARIDHTHMLEAREQYDDKNRCCGCKFVHRNGKDWLYCGDCNNFVTCPRHVLLMIDNRRHCVGLLDE